MSLIKQNGLPIFKPATGFKYPHYWQYYQAHDRMHWVSEELNLAPDVSDYTKADDREKEYIKSVMRLFTQNEVLVGTGYNVLLRIFKPTEVLAMLASFNAREYTHIENYSLFTETIGIGDEVYSEFFDIPIMATKTDYLDKAKVRKYEEYKAMGLSEIELHKVYRSDIARMLAVYGGGAEGIALMAQFAALFAFQFQGKYPGLCTIVDFSIKEETAHCEGNSHLFRDFITENPDIWTDELKYDIYEAIREMVAYEEALVEYLDPPHMKKEDLIKYIRFCGDNVLKRLGMKSNWNINVNPLPFMDDVVGSVQTDFFSGRVTEYTKQVQGNWGSIDYTNWIQFLNDKKV